MPAHLPKVTATGQQLVALSQFADDLLRRMPPSFAHDCCPPHPMLGHRTRKRHEPAHRRHLTTLQLDNDPHWLIRHDIID